MCVYGVTMLQNFIESKMGYDFGGCSLEEIVGSYKLEFTGYPQTEQHAFICDLQSEHAPRSIRHCIPHSHYPYYFVVYYKPRISQFIIGLNKISESVGMRFEGEDTPERRVHVG